LLIRGGFIFQIGAGVYDFLPLGFRVLDKIDKIIKEELAKKDVQHLLMPFVHPASLWQETGRYDKIDVLQKITSQRGSEHVLAPTHEETVTDLARNFIHSYKDLPVILNQNQWKYRDEVRATGGLLRTREFLMQDAYSFDIDEAGLSVSFDTMSEAYNSIFGRIGIPIHVVKADSGTIGGSASEEFMMLSDVGEDVILVDEQGGYSANVEKAESKFETFDQDLEMKPMELVEGKGIVGVEALAAQLGVPFESTTKTMLFEADEEIVAVMIRGDYDINETKLLNVLGCNDLKLASADQVKSVTGAEVGYAGPVGLPKEVRLIADLTCKDRVNFEAGSNKTDYHNINVNFERDFPTPEFVDLREVKEGDISPVSENKLLAKKAIELGHVFKLGTVYSEKMDAKFVDSDGKQKPIEMGCYGIGITRVLAAIVEHFNDEGGILWPKSVTPFHVHIVSVGKDDAVVSEADKLYSELLSAGFDVLYDDRLERPGSKFSDADLLGIPVRLVVSQRNIEERAIEFKERSSSESVLVLRDKVIDVVKSYYA
jgi:prolyl-tRNA synthetase